MTTIEIAELVGYLAAAWSIGFSGGYTMTKFKHAVNSVV